MLILPIYDAKDGMVLAAPVPHPQHPDTDLLKAGYVLEGGVVKRLQQLGIEYLYVDYPGLEDLDRHLGVLLSPARQAVYKQVKNAIANVQKNSKPVVTYNAYYDSTRELISTLMNQGQHPVFMDQMARMGDDMIGHCTAVAHLALMLGIKLEVYLIDERKRLPAQRAKDPVSLGVAGMLHDMGKAKLPEALQKYNEVNPPPPELKEEFETHTRLGFEALQKGEGIEPSAAAAVLHHHQHFDGTGFPDTRFADGTKIQLAEKRIHIFARILYAANLYDRLTVVDGRRRSNLEILHLMHTQYAKFTDPVVLQALRQICPPFPPGSRLTLSDGTDAVVTRLHPNDPLAPIVKRVNKTDLTMEAESVDLKKDTSLKVFSVGETKVSDLMPALVA